MKKTPRPPRMRSLAVSHLQRELSRVSSELALARTECARLGEIALNLRDALKWAREVADARPPSAPSSPLLARTR